MRTSNLLRESVNRSGLRHFQIAALAGLHPSTVSKVLGGRARLCKDDPRALAIARVLGVTPEQTLQADSEDVRPTD